MQNSQDRRSKVVALWIVIAAYVIVGLLWIVVVPPFESPDEIHHFAYVQFVAQTGRLPVQRQEDSPFLEHEAHQPPLYYVLGAGVYRIALALGAPVAEIQTWEKRINPDFYWRSEGTQRQNNFFLHRGTLFQPDVAFPYALFVVRLFSLALGAAGLLGIYAAGRTVWPNRQGAAFLTASLAGFLPQFSFITASVNNDNLAVALGAVSIAQMLRLARCSTRWWGYLLLGLLLGVGLLAKLTLLSLLPIALMLPLLHMRGKRLAAAWGALSAGVAGVSGWWFVRNALLYGDLLGDHWRVNPEAFAWDLDPKPLFSDYFLPQNFWRQIAESFVGRFGFMHISLPSTLYALYLGLIFMGFIAAVPLLLRKGAATIPQRLLLISLGVIVLAVAQLVYLNLRVSQPQGRYLFHILAAVAIVVVSGLWWIGAAIIGSRTVSHVDLTYLCLALVVCVNLYVLQQLHTAYTEPSTLSLLSALFAPLR